MLEKEPSFRITAKGILEHFSFINSSSFKPVLKLPEEKEEYISEKMKEFKDE